MIFAAFLSAAGGSTFAADQVVAYQLYGAQLSNGSYVTGTFSYDFTRNAVSAVDLVAEGLTFDLAHTSVSTTDIIGYQIWGVGQVAVRTDLMIGFSTTLAPNQTTAISLDPNVSSLVNDADVPISLNFVAGTVIPVSFLPQTSAVLTGIIGSNGWFHGPITFALTAKPGRYPLAGTYAALDGGLDQKYAQPLTFTTEGNHTIIYWSVDTHGFAETDHTLLAGIDTVAPSTASYIYRASQVTLSASDATSGVAATYYRIDTGPIQVYSAPFVASTFGPHTVKFWSVDVAGNVEVQQSLLLNSVDVTPPTIPGAPHVLSSTAKTKTVTWTASTDNVRVVKYVLYTLRGHSGRGGGYSWVPFATCTTNKITLPNQAYYGVEVAAFDAAGNGSARSAPGTF